ncbi:MAG: hypothetical protein ACI88G_000663 [Woeseiaceae bacterium]|jgi:hypothetical protein
MNDDLSATTKLVTSLRPLFSFGWRMLLTLTVSRFIFVSWQWQRVADADIFGSVLVQGLQFDLVLSGLMLVIPVLAFPILASNRFLVPAWRALLSVCLPLALLITVFIECSTPSFVDQFDSRPNILFMEYLNHPREVAATLWGAYKLPIVVTILFVTSLTWLNSRQIGRLVTQIQPTGVMPAILATPVLLIICAGLIRSTLDHHPANPGTVALANDPLVNELALSSTYTTFDGRLTAEDLVDPELAKRALVHSARSSMSSDKSL